MLRIVAGTLLGSVAVVALSFGVARAQDSSSSDTVFVTPSYFDGFYAGVFGGIAGNAQGNFYPSGGIARGEAGVVAGWNADVMPDVVAGAEVMIAGQSDFGGTYSYAALALAQIGRLVEDDIAFYLVAGGGVFGTAPAFAFGARGEMAIYDNMSVRAEMLNLVQVGPSWGGGTNVPGVTAQMLNVGVLWHMNDSASGSGWHFDLDPAANVPDFDGFYGGASFGLHHNPANNFFPDVGFGAHPTRADLGGFLGWNYELNEWVVVGIEAQAGLLFDSSGDVGTTAFGLARAGITPLDGVLVYGQGGVGVVQGKFAYGAGGGIEYAAFDNAALRFEGLAYGEPGGPAAFTSAKVAAGVLWHIN